MLTNPFTMEEAVELLSYLEGVKYERNTIRKLKESIEINQGPSARELAASKGSEKAELRNKKRKAVIRKKSRRLVEQKTKRRKRPSSSR